MSVSGISGVTVGTFDIDRESDAEITVELTFDRNITTDGTLTFTVGADAIAGYNGPALTAQVSVTASRENALGANFPNPFNPETWIPYQLGKPANVTISIYNQTSIQKRRTNLMKKMTFFTLILLVLSTISLQTAFAQVTLEGHTGEVWSVSFSPDGTTLASGSDDNTVKLWDVATRTNIATLQGHTDWVWSVSFSPDGTTLASGSSDNTVKLWDVATRTNIATLQGHTDWITSVSFSPDGTTLASGSDDGTVKLWDVATRTNIATLQGHTDWITSVSFSPDGTTLASGSSDNTVKLWDVATRTNIATLQGHTNWITSVSFSPDGTTLASGSDDGTVKLWDVATRTNIATLQGHTNEVWSVSFSPDGTTLASAGDSFFDDGVKLWDVATRTNIATLQGHTNEVWSVSFSPDGTTLASGSWDNTVKLWDVVEILRTTLVKISGDNQQGTFGSTLANPLAVEVRDRDNNPLQGVEVTFTVIYGEGLLNGGSTVAHVTTDANGRATRTFTLGHDPETNTVEVSIGPKFVTFHAVGISPYQITALEGHTNRVQSVLFSPDGTTLASTSSDGTVKLWDVATKQNIATLQGHTDDVWSVSFSPDGTTLASGSWDNTVKLWDVATRTNIATLQGHTDDVWSVSFSPDGTTLASGSDDGKVKLWDVATRTNIATLQEHTRSLNSVSFSPDGTTFASGSSDKTVKLWDVATRTNIATLQGHTRSVESVSFSPDSTTLASGSSDGTVKLWDVATRTNIATLQEHTSEVWSVSFSPDGTTLASGSSDKTVKLWDVATHENIATLEGHTNRVWSVSFSPDGTTLASGSSDGTSILWDMSSYITPITPPESLTGDVNQDGVVNIQDLVLVASNFGKTGQNAADVNGDGVVNIQDLVLVAAAFGNSAAAPPLNFQSLSTLTAADVKGWLTQARQLNLTDATSQRGILFLEQLLVVLTPKETALLHNFPNPFNPETWIPYHLSKDADVTLHIYAVNGTLVRTLALGHQAAGMYQNRSRAAHWDGKNEFGESVASGVYFYTFTAGDFSATRKMLIRK